LTKRAEKEAGPSAAVILLDEFRVMVYKNAIRQAPAERWASVPRRGFVNGGPLGQFSWVHWMASQGPGRADCVEDNTRFKGIGASKVGA